MKQEIYDIPVLHHAVPASRQQFSRLAVLPLIAQPEETIVLDDLCPNEPRSKSEWMTREDGAMVRSIERAPGKKVECRRVPVFDYKKPAPARDAQFARLPPGRTPGKEGYERVGLESKKDKFHWISFFFHDNDRFEAKEGILPKRPGAYKSEKRRKELSRQKKQEERRERKFQKGDRAPSDAEKVEQESNQAPNP